MREESVIPLLMSAVMVTMERRLELITRTFLDILSSVCIGNLVSVDSGAVPML